MGKQVLQEVIDARLVDFPAGVSAAEIANIFDTEGDGDISHEEFTIVLGRICLSSEFQLKVMSFINQSYSRRRIGEIQVAIADMNEGIKGLNTAVLKINSRLDRLDAKDR